MIIDPRAKGGQGGGISSGTCQEIATNVFSSGITNYTPTSGFTTINNSAITAGGNIDIKDYSFVVDNWTQTDWANFYTYFSGLTSDERFKVTLLFGNNSGFGNFMACKLFNVNGDNFEFQGSDTAEDNNHNGRIQPNRLKWFYVYSNGRVVNNLRKFSNVVALTVNINSPHNITLENCSILNINRSLWGGGFEVTAYLKSGSTPYATTTVKGSSEMSGDTRVIIITMDWQYDDKNIHAAYSIDEIYQRFNLLSWEETPIGGGDCNYQIVDNLSAVTNPQEGTKVYVRDSYYYYDVVSGVTLRDINVVMCDINSNLEIFLPADSGDRSIQIREKSTSNVIYQSGKLYRETDGSFIPINFTYNNELYKLIINYYGGFNTYSVALVDSQYTLTNLHADASYFNGNMPVVDFRICNEYIYDYSNNWREIRNVYRIDDWTQQNYANFIERLNVLNEADRYEITLISTRYYYALKLINTEFNQYGQISRAFFQGSDSYKDVPFNGEKRAPFNRYVVLQIENNGNTSIYYDNQGYTQGLYVNYTGHTVSGSTDLGYLYRGLDGALGGKHPMEDNYVAMLISPNDKCMATCNMKSSRYTDDSGNTHPSIICEWEINDSGNTTNIVRGEWYMPNSWTITNISWEETPITTLKLGNTSLTEAQLQALIALIPS